MHKIDFGGGACTPKRGLKVSKSADTGQLNGIPRLKHNL
jgi:hypothetical protein